MILIKLGSDVRRRSAGERILGQEIQNFLLSLQEPKDKVHKPRVVFIATKSSKPYLPI